MRGSASPRSVPARCRPTSARAAASAPSSTPTRATPSSSGDLEERRPRRSGWSPLECGERVLAGIRNDDLYIFTHREFREGADERFRAMLASFPDEPRERGAGRRDPLPARQRDLSRHAGAPETELTTSAPCLDTRRGRRDSRGGRASRASAQPPTEAVQKRRCASRDIGMRAPTRGAFPRLGGGVRQCVQWDF